MFSGHHARFFLRHSPCPFIQVVSICYFSSRNVLMVVCGRLRVMLSPRCPKVTTLQVTLYERESVRPVCHVLSSCVERDDDAESIRSTVLLVTARRTRRDKDDDSYSCSVGNTTCTARPCTSPARRGLLHDDDDGDVAAWNFIELSAGRSDRRSREATAE